MSARDDAAWCLAGLRRHDRDRYLTSLFAPAAARPALWALYAFDLELARVRGAVSEPLPGLIRLQWWREAVDGMRAGTVRGHPVVRALAAAAGRHDLDRARLLQLIDARERDLDGAPPPDLASLVRHAGSTAGTLQELAVGILGGDGDGPRRAAHLVGVAWALAGVPHAVASRGSAGRNCLPADLVAASGAAAAPSPALAGIVARIGAEAERRLAAGRAVRGLSRPVRRGLLIGVLADARLAALRRADNDPFAARPPPAGVWRLAAAALAGRF